jgi:prolyl oligopeptidase
VRSKPFLAIILLLIIGACGTGSEDAYFNQILDDEWSRGMEENPVYASYMGDKSANQDWPDISDQAVRERQKKTREVLEKIKSVNPQKLTEENQLNYRLFLYNYERSVKSQKFDSHLLTFGQRGGIQLEQETAEGLSFNSSQDYKDWLARLEKLPELINTHIDLGKLGIEKSITAPNILMQRVAKQIQLQLVDDPEDSPFYNVFSDIPKTINDWEALQIQAKEVIKEQVVPAYQTLDFFFRTEYLPMSRDTYGVSALPNGYEWYENLAAYHTTTDLSPDEIHNIGLSEVKRIRSEMQEVIDSIGFEGTFNDFLIFLRTDPQFYYETEDELFEAYLATSKKIDPEIVRLFKVLPRTPYGLKPIPKESAPDTTTAYYMRPAADGSRAGYYYVNLYRPEVRPKFEMEVLSVHEAVPGHHLQIALAMELEGIPNFRKYSGYTAFVEGWGLYSESLGYDIGLYEDPYSKFGALTYDMWRAVRLVVDTGMHYKGWSRQQAIDFFKDNAAKTEQDIVNEIDRYLIMPGQALAYKIGQLKLLELKQRAKNQLGDQFDIKEFHHAVLSQGALPLAVLEERIDDYLLEVK